MRNNQGFTLMELIVVLAIISIILYVAVPSMSEFMDRRRIINTAEAIYGEFQYARSEAIARSQEVHVSISVDGGDDTDWAIGVSTTENCDPTITDLTDVNACIMLVDDGDGNIHGTDPDGDGTTVNDTDDLVLHVLDSSDFPEMSITGVTFNGNDTAFDPARGVADTEGTITLQYARHGLASGSVYEMRVVLGVIGRVLICTPDNANTVTGYTTCP